MTEDSRLEELLDRWDALRRQGRRVSVEEVCRDCPELLGEMKRRIRALEATHWLTDSDLPSQRQDQSPQAESSASVPETLGRYRLDRLAGMGGSGQVWKGFDPELQRVVAIKVPRFDRVATPEQAKMFLDEARKLARLKHPGIVTVHDVGREGNVCYIVSDFLEGGSLSQWLAERRADWQEAARIVADVAEILEFAHQQGFVHRDIKPGNILLNTQGKPFLADFGIAVSPDDPARSETSTPGTLAYMSPEQVRGDAIDCRTDIYSLGVVLYWLLTGSLPFAHSEPTRLQTAILAEPPRQPRSLADAIPAELERICLKALAKERTDRYATAGELAADLRAMLLPSRRRRIVSVGGGLLVGAALVSILVARAWSDSRATWEESQKRVEAQSQRATQEVERIHRQLTTVQPARPQSGDPSPAGSGQAMLGTQASQRPPLSLSILDTAVDLTGRKVLDADFGQLGSHPLLRKIVLAHTPTTDQQLSHLSHATCLETLDLTDTPISDNGMEHVSKIPLLQHLLLAETQVTDAGLKAISSLHLRSLDLSRTKITDAGLAYLEDRYGVAGSITVLRLRDTAVTDGSAKSIRQMSNLRELQVGGTKITTPCIEELKATLPNCVIAGEP